VRPTISLNEDPDAPDMNDFANDEEPTGPARHFG
jgi:hypothetical protein